MENIKEYERSLWEGDICEYHTTRTFYKCEKNEKNTIGIELETTEQNQYDISCEGWTCEYDSSITGLEYISPVYAISEKQKLFDDIETLTTNILPYCRNDVSKDRQSGLHIHIGKNYIKHNKIILLNEFLEENYIYLLAISGRHLYNYTTETKNDNSYFEEIPSWDTTNTKIQQYSSRYSIVNYNENTETFEFRLWNSTLNTKTIQERINITIYIIDYINTRKKDITWNNFEKYIQKRNTQTYEHIQDWKRWRLEQVIQTYPEKIEQYLLKH